MTILMFIFQNSSIIRYCSIFVVKAWRKGWRQGLGVGRAGCKIFVSFLKSLIINNFMFLVECPSVKDQKQLQEEFNREGDFFSIPIKKTKPLHQMIRGLQYQYFSEEEETASYLPQPNQPLHHQHRSQLRNQVRKLVEDMLKMKVSFISIRKIFQIIKETEDTLNFYHEHIVRLNSILRDEEEEEENEKNMSTLHTLPNLLQQEENSTPKNSNTLLRQIKLQKISLKTINENSCISTLSLSPRNYRQYSIKQKEIPHKDLRIQIPTSPQGFCNYTQQQDSDRSSNMELIRIGEETPDKWNNSTLNLPSWKKIQEEKKKSINHFFPSLVLQQPESNRLSQSSEFADNLSTQIVPMPSVLNESFREILKRQEKPNMMRDSIFALAKPINQQKIYEDKMRQIKLNQKLRKGASKRKQSNARRTADSKQIERKGEPTMFYKLREPYFQRKC